MPNKKLERLTTHPGSDLRQLEIQYNELAKTVAAMQLGQTGDAVLRWYGVGPNSAAAPMAIGSTDTRVGTAACLMTILGVPVVKAVSDAGTAFGALGTIPAATWGVIALDVVAAGTVTFLSGAANYTTGYATEALAIAALPKRVTVKARMGYVTILAPAGGFVVGTNSLAGGATDPATTTNYYPVDGICAPTGTALGPNAVVTAQVDATGSPWTGGKNGVMIATALAIGSTDTRVGSTAFTYNANGLTDIPKAAVAAGTAFGALGTIPASKWGLIVFLINGAGTVTYMSAPGNYGTGAGYQTEAAAIADLSKIFPASGLCMFGYVTIKASASGFVVGTDSPTGGASGNVATATNYYPTAGITLGAGVTASLLANREGTVLSSTQY